MHRAKEFGFRGPIAFTQIASLCRWVRRLDFHFRKRKSGHDSVLLKQFGHFSLKDRQFHLKHVPDHVVINHVMAVYQDVPKGDDSLYLSDLRRGRTIAAARRMRIPDPN